MERVLIVMPFIADVLPYSALGNTLGDKPKGILGIIQRAKEGLFSPPIPTDYHKH
jgi:hypothetical protein